ncbi:MAG: type II secretion system protein [Clostridia bacterium]|nr:type II secretion system protein [Clostridia bacterium]
MKRNNKKGFTIVELVIVIAVIGILAAVLIPTFSGIIESANETKALQEVKNAYTATLADDLADGDTSNDVVHGQAIIVNHNNILISIDTNGAATVVETGTATHTLANGKLTKNN